MRGGGSRNLTDSIYIFKKILHTLILFDFMRAMNFLLHFINGHFISSSPSLSQTSQIVLLQYLSCLFNLQMSHLSSNLNILIFLHNFLLNLLLNYPNPRILYPEEKNHWNWIVAKKRWLLCTNRISLQFSVLVVYGFLMILNFSFVLQDFYLLDAPVSAGDGFSFSGGKF